MLNTEILQLPIEEAEFSVVDVETTGLGPANNNIIEIGLVKIKNFKVIDRYNSFINPGRSIPPFITQFTGITNDDVYDAPFFEELVKPLQDFLEDSVLVGHNLQFDLSFLRKEFNVCGIENYQPLQLCTLRLARRMLPNLKSRSLGNLATHLRLKNEDAHRAYADVEVTAKILYHLIEQLKASEGFQTVQEFINYQYQSVQLKPKVPLKKNLADAFLSLPKSPGVYFFLNKKEEIIYIGKAKSLRDRIKSYLVPASARKSKKILTTAHKFKTITTKTELTALLAEAELIKKVNPKMNVMLKQYHNKYFLRFSVTHSAPKIELTNKFSFDGNDYFGMFISRKLAQQVLEMIDKIFLLRECDEKEFKKKRRCFLADIERCTAPCIGNAIEPYLDEVQNVYEFLYGKNQFAVNRLVSKMKSYSDQLRFEKAAEVKELISLVLSQIHKSSLLAEPINTANVLFEISGFEGQKDYVLLLAGKLFIKDYVVNDELNFDRALDDYFDRTTQLDFIPTEEDLEKIKISLNWITQHRHAIKIFYLKEYGAKAELFNKMERGKPAHSSPSEHYFEINNFLPQE
ncbi:MAG: exonuclease domain-containing protein [Ignavibacteria bacterium]|nr:exonuclease domain-containing protein [Ignavibacteria bacterium]